MQTHQENKENDNGASNHSNQSPDQHQLPPGWIKWKLFEGTNVYYNYQDRVFSLTPPMDLFTFLSIAIQMQQSRSNQNQSVDQPANSQKGLLSIADLQKQIDLVEITIRSQNNGQLPPKPKSITQQLQEMINQGQLSGLQAGDKLSDNLNGLNKSQDGKKNLQSQAKKPNHISRYQTHCKVADIKGISSESEIISALTTLCSQLHQLQPTWKSIENKGQRDRFECQCEFHGVWIATAKGSNCKEAKKACAKIAMQKIAPYIFKEMFPNEELLKDIPTSGFQDESKLAPKAAAAQQPLVNPSQKVSQQSVVAPNVVSQTDQVDIKKNEDLTLNDIELIDRKVFQTYNPHSMSKLWAKFKGYILQPTDGQNKDQQFAMQYYYHLRVMEKSTRIYETKTFSSNKKEAKQKASLEFLKHLHGPQTNWLELVKRTSEEVDRDRAQRGAGEKAILKKNAHMQDKIALELPVTGNLNGSQSCVQQQLNHQPFQSQNGGQLNINKSQKRQLQQSTSLGNDYIAFEAPKQTPQTVSKQSLLQQVSTVSISSSNIDINGSSTTQQMETQRLYQQVQQQVKLPPPETPTQFNPNFNNVQPANQSDVVDLLSD